MRIVVTLQRNAIPNVVLNQLYNHTPLQSSFAFNMLALVPAKRSDGSPYVLAGSKQTQLEPQVLSLLQLLEFFIEHRRDVVRRRTQYELARARTRAHLLLGFLVALDNIDRVISIIRESDTVEVARERLIAEPFVLSDAFRRMARTAIDDDFRLSGEQAAAIVDMRLRTLVGLERQKIESEHSELVTLIGQLEELLASAKMILEVVKTETLDISKRYGDKRKTPVEALEGELSIEDIIADTEVVITSTVGGYIKRVSVDTFSSAESRWPGRRRDLEPQKRGRRRELFRCDHAPACAVLHQQGPRVSAAGVRDPRFDAPITRYGAGQSADASARRVGHCGVSDSRLRGRQLSCDGDASGCDQKDETRRVLERAPQRPQRDRLGR